MKICERYRVLDGCDCDEQLYNPIQRHMSCGHKTYSCRHAFWIKAQSRCVIVSKSVFINKVCVAGFACWLNAVLI